MESFVGRCGATSEDYREQAALIPFLYHLATTTGISPIINERFSPYVKDWDSLFNNPSPNRGYQYVYPPKMFAIDKIAYSYDRSRDDTCTEVKDAIGECQRRWRKGNGDGVIPRAPHSCFSAQMTGSE